MGKCDLSYCVRRMTEDDISAVSELDRRIFPDMKMPTNFENELKNCMAHYIVACECDSAKSISSNDSNVIGYAGLWIMVSEAHIVNIAVAHNYRRRGLGELLLLALIELALDMKCNMMTLEVRASNVTAQRLYQKYGFTSRGIRKGYYNDNREDGIIMTVDNIMSKTFREACKKLKSDYQKKRGAAEIILTAPFK